MPSLANRHSACTVIAAGVIAAAGAALAADQPVQSRDLPQPVSASPGPLAGLRGEALSAHCRAWGAFSQGSKTYAWKSNRMPDPGQRANLLAEADRPISVAAEPTARAMSDQSAAVPASAGDRQ